MTLRIQNQKKSASLHLCAHWSYSLINMMQDRNYSVQVVYSLFCGSVSVNKTIESRSRSLYYFVFVDDKQIHIPLCCLLNPTSSLRMNMTSCKIDHNLSPLCTLTKASFIMKANTCNETFLYLQWFEAHFHARIKNIRLLLLSRHCSANLIPSYRAITQAKRALFIIIRVHFNMTQVCSVSDPPCFF